MNKSEVTIARRKRLLEEGRCPIHGGNLRLIRCVEFWERAFFCQEQSCRIFGIGASSELPLKVVEEFAALFDVAAPDPNFTGISHRKKGPKSRWSRVWLKTQGQCFYCGSRITLDETTVDHFLASSVGGNSKPENLVPSCLRCNCAKGDRSIEAYRFALQMRAFVLENHVEFSRAQYLFLLKTGKDIGLPAHQFWFEQAGLAAPKGNPPSHPRRATPGSGDGGGNVQ